MTYREHIKALEAIARAEGDADFADMLFNYRAALTFETRDSERCRDEAWSMAENCQRVVNRLNGAADALDDYMMERA